MYNKDIDQYLKREQTLTPEQKETLKRFNSVNNMIGINIEELQKEDIRYKKMIKEIGIDKVFSNLKLSIL